MASVVEAEGLEAEFMKWMCDYLVAMTVNFEGVKEKGELENDRRAFSGFVIAVRDHSYWVTAGHCMKILEDIIKYRKVDNISLMDRFGTKPKHEHVVPFGYSLGDAKGIHRKSLGLDFAVVKLADFQWRSLETNGIKRVTRSMWHERPDRAYFDYKVLGLPRHLIEGIGESSWGARPVAAGLDRLTPADAPEPVSENWFVGQLKPEADALGDIVGMSGGPIFAFAHGPDSSRPGDNRPYDIVAVQSSWYEKERIILGCPLAVFAEVLHEELGE